MVDRDWLTDLDWPWERKRLVCPHSWRGNDQDIALCPKAVLSDRPWPEIDRPIGPEGAS